MPVHAPNTHQSSRELNALAFLFGYGLTRLPLLRAGMALPVVIPLVLASDTLGIAVTELVDNAVIQATGVHGDHGVHGTHSEHHHAAAAHPAD